MDNLPPSATGSSRQEQNQSPAEQLKSGVEGAKKEAAKFKDAASEQATASLESAKTNLKEAAQEAAGYSQGVLNEQKNRLAQLADEYSKAAQEASDKLNQEGHAALARRAQEMASRLSRASDYLRERELSKIYYDAEQVTRRRPEIVFGMMFTAGLVAARFLKASKRGETTGRARSHPSKRFLPSIDCFDKYVFCLTGFFWCRFAY
jgi:hypothetical protein